MKYPALGVLLLSVVALGSLSGGALTDAAAGQRQRWDPLSGATWIKGAGEGHLLASRDYDPGAACVSPICDAPESGNQQ